jgi:hypothetical protein
MMETVQQRRGFPRAAICGAAALLFAAPWLAMQAGTDVQWSGFDFMIWGTMLIVAGAVADFALRAARRSTSALAGLIAIGAGFFTVWANLAVGIIGNENDPHNVPFLLVPAVALIGGFLGRLRARPMALVMVAAATMQLVAALLAISDGRVDQGSRANEIVIGTIIMPCLWLWAAALYRKAAAASPEA